MDKVHISIDEASATNLSITITDANELTYEFSDKYVIYEKNQNLNNNLDKDTCKFYASSDKGTTKIEYDWSELCGALEKRRIYTRFFYD